ncbi:hypothetical protein [cf. Phormidesmis sp. LEGE 11477]|uniref:hypothetical protein n=1 Tax=cf. Phormidesmis sp. LEGE 11477 TaxID=1828680 RepID=UPI00187F2A44|nr:hypothetical protein [cf. Phormidesmis sp. LEGE 11477]MBE9063025.1 hypothetical protein [cf. Phormidesmis sp. LEGE 11477]
MHLTLSKQKFLFLLGITAIYTAMVAWLDFLQGPYLWDEKTFWQTSLTFSERLFPTLDQLRDYSELNTPLPFIIFGALEYLLGKGIVIGRALNLALSLAIVFIIGWPKQKGCRALLCVVGLFICPYYLFFSGRLYTEMIACFWVVMGLVSYVKDRSWLSCASFVLAIASRQYMIAFPVAICAYETVLFCIELIRERKADTKVLTRWLSSLVAILSIFGWFYLFDGLTPEIAAEVRNIPKVQQETWAFTPGGGVNALAFVSVYILIPELLLFERSFWLDIWQQNASKIMWIAIALLLYCLVFPPLPLGIGNLRKVIRLIPFDFIKLLLMYGLALLACIRFSRPNLLSLMVFANALIMFKAYPWDKYILPLAVAFWYIKAHGLEEKFSICISGERANLEPTPSGDTQLFQRFDG